jgi:hypothetical protein
VPDAAVTDVVAVVVPSEALPKVAKPRGRPKKVS